MRHILGKTEPGVNHDSLADDAGGYRHRDLLGELSHHLTRHVLVVSLQVHGVAETAPVTQHQGGSGLPHRVEKFRVGQASRNVVDDVCATLHR